MSRHIDRHLLLEILSFARPHKSETEKRFAREFLDTLPGMKQDSFGNRYLTVGDKPNVLWSCHIDTVAKAGGPQLIAFDPKTGIASLANGKPGTSLGADDGAGVWIMLQMIAAARPGLYVFHRGEEEGCLGSRHLAKQHPKLLDGIDAAVAFDRKGTGDIITHQSFGMTASDDFAWTLAAELGKVKGLDYKPDDTGLYTDTDSYAGIVAECSNLSVGYEGNHGPRETLDVYHCERLLEAMLQLDASKLAIVREPGDDGYGDLRNWKGGLSARDEAPFGEYEDMLDAVRRYPGAAAALLIEAGASAWDLVEIADEEELGQLTLCQ